MSRHDKPMNGLGFAAATSYRNKCRSLLIYRSNESSCNKRCALLIALTVFIFLVSASRLRAAGSARAFEDWGWLDTAASWEAHRAARQALSKPWSALLPRSNHSESDEQRLLILYSYKHDEWRLQNLAFFLRHGLAERASNGMLIDYVLIINGEDSEVRTLLADMRLSYDYIDTTSGSSKQRVEHGRQGPPQPTLVLVHRHNVGYEFCAIQEVLGPGHIPHPHTYTYVITMNGSVRGPFLPPAFRGVWPDIFLSELGLGTGSSGVDTPQGAAPVGLVGTTLNCMTWMADMGRRQRLLHLQSMLLAWRTEALLSSSWVFECLDNTEDVIAHCEVGTTQAVLAAGYAIGALQQSMAGYKVKDLNDGELWRRCGAVDGSRGGGDPYYEGVYAGGNLHPYELVFIKTNRHVEDETITRLTRLHDTYHRVS